MMMLCGSRLSSLRTVRLLSNTVQQRLPQRQGYLPPRRTLFGFGSKSSTQEDQTTTDIANEAKELHENILHPMNSRFLGPLEKHSDQMMPKPMVFVLGNHSSGEFASILQKLWCKHVLFVFDHPCNRYRQVDFHQLRRGEGRADSRSRTNR